MCAFGCELFIEKCKMVEPNVVDLLNKSFFKQNNTWFIGYRFRTPTTDNALENFNGDIKKFQTDHKRKPLKEFLSIALKMARQRSREYLSIPKPSFQRKMQIPNDILLKGSLLERSHVHYINRDEGTIEFYMFSTEEDERMGHRAITNEDVNDFKATAYESFTQFSTEAFRVWRIVFPIKKDDWLDKTTCTCPAYDVHYVCKHIVSLAILYKMPLPEIPNPEETAEPNFDYLPILAAKTKKTGRPKKAGPALLVE